MINYQLTNQEVVRGLLKYRRFRARFWIGVILGVCGISFLALGFKIHYPESNMVFLEGCLMLGISLSLFTITPLLVRRAYTKAVRNNPIFTDPKEVTFDEQGLVFISPNQRSEVKWAAFKRITQDEQYFYLHSDTLGTVTLLPKRAFDETGTAAFLRCSHFPASS